MARLSKAYGFQVFESRSERRSHPGSPTPSASSSDPNLIGLSIVDCLKAADSADLISAISLQATAVQGIPRG